MPLFRTWLECFLKYYFFHTKSYAFALQRSTPVNPHTPPPRAVRAHQKPESNNVILTLIGSDKSKGAKNFLRNHGKNSLWLHLFGSKLTYLIQIQQASRDASCLLWSIVNQATKKVDWIINRLSIPRAAYTQNDFRAGNVCKYKYLCQGENRDFSHDVKEWRCFEPTPTRMYNAIPTRGQQNLYNIERC